MARILDTIYYKLRTCHSILSTLFIYHILFMWSFGPLVYRSSQALVSDVSIGLVSFIWSGIVS